MVESNGPSHKEMTTMHMNIYSLASYHTPFHLIAAHRDRLHEHPGFGNS